MYSIYKLHGDIIELCEGQILRAQECQWQLNLISLVKRTICYFHFFIVIASYSAKVLSGIASKEIPLVYINHFRINSV
jgi:hypothetical protein